MKLYLTVSFPAQAPGFYDLHMRREGYERYFCGEEAKRRFPEYVRRIVVKGVPIETRFLPEIVAAFYYDCIVRPKYSPVIILQPPGGWTEDIKGQLAHTFVRRYSQPSVSFLSSAVAVLCG